MSGKNRTIFIVDEDAQVIEGIRSHIAKHSKASVTSFASVDNAIQNLEQDPDIIITDLYADAGKQETMNGLELLKTSKKHDSKVKVILMSNREGADLPGVLYPSGAYDYILKDGARDQRLQRKLDHIFFQMDQEDSMKLYRKTTFFILGLLVLAVMLMILLKRAEII